MTITEFQSAGGKARWKGINKKKRSEMMSELARLSRKNSKGKKNGADKP